MTGARVLLRAALVAAAVLAAAGAPRTAIAQVTGGSDWPQYLHDVASSGYTPESLITRGNAVSLKEKTAWPVHLSNGAACPSPQDYCSGTLTAQPMVATVAGSTLVYEGSWNGSEYALCADSCTVGGSTYATGQQVWSTYVGRTSGCGGPLKSQIVGVSGATPVSTISVAGVPTAAVFVGAGGDIDQSGAVLPSPTSQLLALDALSGAVIWSTPLGAAPSHYLWSSPVLANGSLYIGMASLGDCPLVQGELIQLDPNTGAVLNTFKAMPDGCTGGGIWGSATVDASGDVWVATGNPNWCATGPDYGEALVELSPSLSVLSSWRVPAAEETSDGDFGSTPTLFTGTVTPGGAQRSLIGVPNKNGIYYVFDTAQPAAGPVARLQIALASRNPTSGGGSISPSSWDGTRIYVAGGKTTIGTQNFPGSLRAFDPNNLSGAPVWVRGLASRPVLGAVSTDPGLAVVGHGAYLTVVNAATGNRLFRGVGSHFLGAASIAYGVMYIGDTAGMLHAFSVNGA